MPVAKGAAEALGRSVMKQTAAEIADKAAAEKAAQAVAMKAGTTLARKVLKSGATNESQGQFSPDGKWIAYVSDESGNLQVYVQSFPELTGKWQVSAGGGSQPRWRRDGKDLFYVAPDRRMMAVTIKAGATFEAEAPRALFESRLPAVATRQTYAVSADGQRFLLNAPLDAESPPMTIVLNWTGLLKR
jgi:hypothetical protein